MKVKCFPNEFQINSNSNIYLWLTSSYRILLYNLVWRHFIPFSLAWSDRVFRVQGPQYGAFSTPELFSFAHDRRSRDKRQELWGREWVWGGGRVTVTSATILVPRAALFLVSTKNRDLWLKPGRVQQRKSAIHGLPVTLRMLRIKSDKSVWLWSQSIVFTNPFKTGRSLDLARGRDSWCWPKGARPLGTRMLCNFLVACYWHGQCLVIIN